MSRLIDEVKLNKDWRQIFDWYPSGLSRLGIICSPDSGPCPVTPFTLADIESISFLGQYGRIFKMFAKLFDGRYVYITAEDTTDSETCLHWQYHHGLVLVSTNERMVVPNE